MSTGATPLPSGSSSHPSKYMDEDSKRAIEFAEYDPTPNHLPSILKYYSNLVPPNPFTSMGSRDFARVRRTLHANSDHANNFKLAVASLSTCVVSVSTFLGVQRKVDCSGIVIGWDPIEKVGTILTSAKVLRLREDATRSHYYVIVRLYNGRLLEAREYYVDCHYNFLVLKVKSAEPLGVLDLRVQEKPREKSDVIALGRDFFSTTLLQEPGVVHCYHPYFGSDDLLSSSCQISEAYEGGPLVSWTGALIGINFMDDSGYACPLPIYSVTLSLQIREKSGTCLRPWFGLYVINLKDLSFDAFEKSRLSFDENVVVRQVIEGSPADKLGVRPGDRIISSGTFKLSSTEEYINMQMMLVWHLSNPAGKGDEVDVIERNPLCIKRCSNGESITLFPEVVDVSDKRFSQCWPHDQSVWYDTPLFGSQTNPTIDMWAPPVW